MFASIILFSLINHFPYCDQPAFSQIAENHLKRAVAGIQLNDRLQFVGGPHAENYESIKSTYAVVGHPEYAMEFLRQSIEAQAYDSEGALIAGSPIKFSVKFPSSWDDPNVFNNDLCTVKYAFDPKPVALNEAKKSIEFRYRYTISVYDVQNGSIPLERNGEFKVEVKPTGLGAFPSFSSGSSK